MIGTFQALGVALLALLPGACFLFAYERRSRSSYTTRLADRMVRFLAISAAFTAATSGLIALFYSHYVATGRLGRGDINAWLVELIAVAWVAVPAALGWLSAHLQGEHQWIAKVLRNDGVQKRAWDYVWQRKQASIVRIRLKSGTWLAGLFHGGWESAPHHTRLRSWAAGYPEQQDLWLSTMLQVKDPATGLLERDGDGRVVPVGGRCTGLLVRWDEIEYLTREEYT